MVFFFQLSAVFGTHGSVFGLNIRSYAPGKMEFFFLLFQTGIPKRLDKVLFVPHKRVPERTYRWFLRNWVPSFIFV